MPEDWPDFATVDINGLFERLLLWVTGRMLRAGWNARRGVPLALGARDYAHTAILKAMSRERTYDPSRTLFDNLCQVVSSEISNVRSSEDTKRTVHADDKVVNIVDYRDSPEEEAIRNNQMEVLFRYLHAKDPETKIVAERILCLGQKKSLEISLELRIPVSEVENIKRRLRRHLAKFLQEHAAPTLANAAKPLIGEDS